MAKRKSVNGENGALIPFKENLPDGMSKEEWEKMIREDLNRTMHGVIPRLSQIKILHAGALMFKFPDGGNKNYFDGIIVDHHPCNAYWEKSFQESGKGNPPNCSSLDGINGTVYGKCGKCAFNQFGSDKKGSGKACKNMKRIHILLENESLPVRLTLPPTSIGVTDEFFTGLFSKGFPVMCKMVRFSLIPAQSSTGIDFSKIHLDVMGQIEIPKYLQIRKMVEEYLTQIRGQEIVADEYFEETKED